ncbi:VPLPA-CTERM sorting domain-containing protein [Actibacterium sp. XHP0104]|uniref:VPLPA-CTERM sorting domain-containing protein n=1 Tax=Actibacterium sp. XHP0104 TaxID=2984335 RepID=UPI0021E77A19|nr:VPLPA-CTERM sorting domain-containing protein [Actibacterium sp. XHP0104]MCV2881846.1 VPLPA-CTERM sorting domain-containing protein [Actibacterium sp. XHP0104]
MKLKVAIGAALTSLVLATTSHAASLSIVGGSAGVLPVESLTVEGYDPTPAVPGVSAGDAITTFTGAELAGGFGLMMDVAASLKYTFLGKEANAENLAVALSNGMTLSNKDAAGTSISAPDDGGIVDFYFQTTFKLSGASYTITNGVGSTLDKLRIAFIQEDSKNVLAFFGDGRQDLDYDDMVIRISIVPLPAGGLLMLSALGGFAALRRRKKA